MIYQKRRQLTKLLNVIKINPDTSKCIPDSKYDKEIASKLKKMLDSDPELNQPSITNSKTQ